MALAACAIGVGALAGAQTPAPRGQTSYAPVAQTEPFDQVMARMRAAKSAITDRHQTLLADRYDLSDRQAAGACNRMVRERLTVARTRTCVLLSAAC